MKQRKQNLTELIALLVLSIHGFLLGATRPAVLFASIHSRSWWE